MLLVKLLVVGVDCEIKFWCLRQSCLVWHAQQLSRREKKPKNNPEKLDMLNHPKREPP